MNNTSLRSILAAAYRCPALSGNCSNVRYQPESGYIPRGYTGATGELHEVKLILCLAEPGDPQSDEKYAEECAEKLIDKISSSVAIANRDGTSTFHRNVRFLLSCCWPDLSFEEQMRRTWITEGVLCSAKKTTGSVPPIVEKECAFRYLAPQLSLLKDAFVIALGKKAERRLQLAGCTNFFPVRAAGMPMGSRVIAEAGWKAAGDAFHAYRQSQNNTGRNLAT